MSYQSARSVRKTSVLLISIALYSGCRNADHLAEREVISDAKCEELSIVDSHGKARLRFACDGPGGSPRILLLDGVGRTRATLLLRENDAPSLAFLSVEGKEEMILEERDQACLFKIAAPQGGCEIEAEVGTAGGVSLHIRDEQERPRISLTIGKEGSENIQLIDEDGMARLFAGRIVSEENEFLFAANSGDGAFRAWIGSRASSGANVAISGKGKSIAALMLDSNDVPSLRFADPSGSSRLEARVGKDGEMQFGILDQHEKPGLLALCPASGFAQLTLSDSSRKPEVFLGRLEDNDIAIGVFADSTSSRCLLGLTDTGRSYLWIRDDSGPKVYLNSDTNGKSGLELYDHGTRRLFLGFDERGQSTMATFDKSGELTWKVK